MLQEKKKDSVDHDDTDIMNESGIFKMVEPNIMTVAPRAKNLFIENTSEGLRIKGVFQY
jgi:hypothetical protein